MIFTVFVTSGF